MHLNLNITDRDINKGERANPSECAIARAIKRNRTIKTASVSVFYDKCVVHAVKNGKTVSYVGRLPDQASTFVHQFDHFKAVCPMSFSIELNKATKAEHYLVK